MTSPAECSMLMRILNLCQKASSSRHVPAGHACMRIHTSVNTKQSHVRAGMRTYLVFHASCHVMHHIELRRHGALGSAPAAACHRGLGTCASKSLLAVCIGQHHCPTSVSVKKSASHPLSRIMASAARRHVGRTRHLSLTLSLCLGTCAYEGCEPSAKRLHKIITW
jgi:hypothetical protein